MSLQGLEVHFNDLSMAKGKTPVDSGQGLSSFLDFNFLLWTKEQWGVWWSRMCCLVVKLNVQAKYRGFKNVRLSFLSSGGLYKIMSSWVKSSELSTVKELRWSEDLRDIKGFLSGVSLGSVSSFSLSLSSSCPGYNGCPVTCISCFNFWFLNDIDQKLQIEIESLGLNFDCAL